LEIADINDATDKPIREIKAINEGFTLSETSPAGIWTIT
jgi:hypothetical protein